MLVALAACSAAPAPAGAAKTKRWRLQSPDGRLAATIRFHGPDAPLRAVVRRRGEPVLTTTIGLATATRCLPQGFTPKATRRDTTFERYRTRAGKRRVHRLLAHRLDLSFRQRGSRVLVELRASDDGFAYRTSLTGPARSRVTGECSAFTAPGAQAWLQRYNRAYEAPYTPSLLRDALPGPVGYPALLRTGGAWALLAESDVGTGQPGTRLEVRPGIADVLFVARPHAQPGLSLVRTPWRVAVIGRLATIVESDLVDDLARPAPHGDWSWAKPGRVAWSWWADSASPASLDAQQAYVDFARRMGWEYVLVDAGWDPAWMPQLVAYARRRDVKVMVWARWDALALPAPRDALLSRLRSWGVAGVKLDFMESDSYQRMAWYRSVARAAAERRLVVNFHGSTAPRGLARSWPNVLTSEGVIGAESYKGPAAAITPAHNATLPFTRNAIGSMDYTPVTFSAARRPTSAAHELALSIVFESGLQHFADRPDVYAAPAGRAALAARRAAGLGRHQAARRLPRRLGDDRAAAPGAAGTSAPSTRAPRARPACRWTSSSPAGATGRGSWRTGRAGRCGCASAASPRAACCAWRSAPRAATRSASSPSGADQSGRRPGRPVPGRCQWATSGSSTSQQR